MLIDYKGPTIGVVFEPNETESNYVNINYFTIQLHLF